MKMEAVLPQPLTIARPDSQNQDRQQKLRQQRRVGNAENGGDERMRPRPCRQRRDVESHPRIRAGEIRIDERAAQRDRQILRGRPDVGQQQQEKRDQDCVRQCFLAAGSWLADEVCEQAGHRCQDEYVRKDRGPGDRQPPATVERRRREQENGLSADGEQRDTESGRHVRGEPAGPARNCRRSGAARDSPSRFDE